MQCLEYLRHDEIISERSKYGELSVNGSQFLSYNWYRRQLSVVAYALIQCNSNTVSKTENLAQAMPYKKTIIENVSRWGFCMTWSALVWFLHSLANRLIIHSGIFAHAHRHSLDSNSRGDIFWCPGFGCEYSSARFSRMNVHFVVPPVHFRHIYRLTGAWGLYRRQSTTLCGTKTLPTSEQRHLFVRGRRFCQSSCLSDMTSRIPWGRLWFFVNRLFSCASRWCMLRSHREPPVFAHSSPAGMF